MKMNLKITQLAKNNNNYKILLFKWSQMRMDGKFDQFLGKKFEKILEDWNMFLLMSIKLWYSLFSSWRRQTSRNKTIEISIFVTFSIVWVLTSCTLTQNEEPEVTPEVIFWLQICNQHVSLNKWNISFKL